MSISLPTWTRREIPLLGRRHRIWAIVSTGLRRETRRLGAIFTIAAGTLITTISSIVLVIFSSFLLGGKPIDLSFFFNTASSGAILFFAILMAAIVGGGLIADDLDTMALSLYLSRPLSPLDYLTAKAAILAVLLTLVTVLPLALTPLVGALLGYFAWPLALEALGFSILLGLLLTAFFTSFALFLSSLTRRRAYAGAAVFAASLGLTLPIEAIASPGFLNLPALYYLSPWDDFLAVARAAFGVSGGPTDWAVALAILLGVTVVAALATYVRMRGMEVVSG